MKALICLCFRKGSVGFGEEGYSWLWSLRSPELLEGHLFVFSGPTSC